MFTHKISIQYAKHIHTKMKVTAISLIDSKYLRNLASKQFLDFEDRQNLKAVFNLLTFCPLSFVFITKDIVRNM